MSVQQARAVNLECVDLPAVANAMRSAGILVYDTPYENDEQLHRRLEGHDTIVHFFTDRPIPESLIATGQIKRIVVAGPAAQALVGSDVIKRYGVEIYDTPAQAVISVAEHTICLLMMLAKNMRQVVEDMQNGDWPKSINSELNGRSIGLIGFGEVARRVAALCRSLGMHVCVAASEPRTALIVECGYTPMSLPVLLASADYVSIHKRYSGKTDPILGREQLQLMQPGCCLINTSRAELVDTGAMLELLESAVLGGAAIDVYDREPVEKNSALRSHRKIIATPHMAWLTDKSIVNMVTIAAQVIGGDLSNARRVQ